MLTYLNLSENYLEVDLNTETVLRIRLDGDITTTKDGEKTKYTTESGLKLIVNTSYLEWTFEICSDTMSFKVSYVDFPDMPEILADCISKYIEARN